MKLTLLINLFSDLFYTLFLSVILLNLYKFKNILMNKIYLAITASAFAFSGIAQKSTLLEKTNSTLHVKQTVTQKPTEFVNWNERGSCIYTNDFSQASDWTIGNNVGNTDNWVIGTAVPSGSFPIPGIASTSEANGFALFDSDLLCSGNQNAYVQIAQPINLTNEPAVSIQFESYYRNFAGECFLEVSNDGMNWSAFQVHTTLASNDATANPTLVEINVTQIIGGAATAYFRFTYVGECDYAWMIDDVCITTPPPNEVEMLTTGFADVVGNIPYTLVPNEQGSSIDNIFWASITNLGANDQTNIKLDVDITNGATTVASLSGIADTLSPAGIYFDTTATSWNVGSTMATYSVDWHIDSDSILLDHNTTNNNNMIEVSVTDHIWARDAHEYEFFSGGLWNGEDGAGISNSFIMVNEFDCFVDQDLEAIQVAFNGNTDAGTTINPVVYQVDATGNFNLVYDGSSYGAEYTIQASDITTGTSPVWVDLPIAVAAGGVLSLTAGEIYLVGIQHYGGQNAVLLLNGGIVAPEQTVFLFDGTQSDWFFMTSTPSIRANFDPAFNSVNDYTSSNFSLEQNVPNPTNGLSTIAYELNTAMNVSFEITDVTGKIIETKSLGSQTSGNHSLEINVANYSKGVYFYTMIAGNEKLTKRMIVTK